MHVMCHLFSGWAPKLYIKFILLNHLLQLKPHLFLSQQKKTIHTIKNVHTPKSLSSSILMLPLKATSKNIPTLFESRNQRVESGLSNVISRLYSEGGCKEPFWLCYRQMLPLEPWLVLLILKGSEHDLHLIYEGHSHTQWKQVGSLWVGCQQWNAESNPVSEKWCLYTTKLFS